MVQKNQENSKGSEYSFPQKVWIAGGIIALIFIILLFLKTTFNVFLLILAGLLIAIFFRGLSSLIEQKTGWVSWLCMSISVLGNLLLIVLISWLIGAKVQAQITELSDTLPTTVENAKAQLNNSSLGLEISKKISSPQTQKKAQTLASTFFRTSFGVLGDIYVILFIGLFFTAAPQLYKKGILQLVPKKGQPKADDILNKIGSNLKKWLKGKLLAMLIVFALTAAGLAIIGIPMWLVLALIAGLLNFIPNFGPLIALIPAVLVALMQGPVTAAFVAGLYIGVQVLESNVITPQIQKKLVSVPPAMIIIAQLFMGVLTGGWGLILATPLLVILMVIIQKLYIIPQSSSAAK
jgi:predicted PurR-regulated permease PerM